MSTLTQFFSHLLHCQYLFKSGKEAVFSNGVYRTDKPSEIAELKAEIEAGHPSIHQKSGQETIQSDLVDPMAAFRAQIEKDYQARLDAAKNMDAGTSDQSQKINIGSTANVGAEASGVKVLSVNNPAAQNPAASILNAPVDPAKVPVANLDPEGQVLSDVRSETDTGVKVPSPESIVDPIALNAQKDPEPVVVKDPAPKVDLSALKNKN